MLPKPSYARPAAHHVRESKAQDEARAERVRNYCAARLDAKLEALRSHLGDLAGIDPSERSGEEILDTCTAMLRDRIRRLEGPR